jgi:hypothetical protein
MHGTTVKKNNVIPDDGPIRAETRRSLMFLKILL